MKTINIKFDAGSAASTLAHPDAQPGISGSVLVRADQVPAGATFSVPQYPGVGTRTCRVSWLRRVGGDTSVIIDCGIGISPLELSPSDVLEVIGGAA